MIRKKKPECIEDKIIEVSFGPKKPVTIKLGDVINSKPGSYVLIEGRSEFIYHSDSNVLGTYSFEGRDIIDRRRCLNLGVMVNFSLLTSLERITPSNRIYKSIYRVLKNSYE
jgi:hypothetical protein